VSEWIDCPVELKEGSRYARRRRGRGGGRRGGGMEEQSAAESRLLNLIFSPLLLCCCSSFEEREEREGGRVTHSVCRERETTPLLLQKLRRVDVKTMILLR
jgi:hypothetical protein